MNIHVRGLSFLSHHGITEEERINGQWLNADIWADVDARAGETDRMEDTVDYVDIAALLVECSESSKSFTLERLAEVYCSAVLERWPLVQRIWVELRKPRPLIPYTVGTVGVSHEKSRG